MSVNWKGYGRSTHGERDRMLPPPDMPRAIEYSCGRTVDADEIAVCRVCDRVFKLKTWDHKYCCHACQVVANNGRASIRDKARRKAKRGQRAG